jgi:hypothetical protein
LQEIRDLCGDVVMHVYERMSRAQQVRDRAPKMRKNMHA